MRQFRFDYSLKNIPIPSQDAYLRSLIQKVESVLKRMRWKAHFYLKGEKKPTKNNSFGLPSSKSPPTVSEIKSFELDVLKLVENIQFRHIKDQFQQTLANDLKKVKTSPNVFVFADKTRNINETSLNTCNKLMQENITKTYKHGSEDNIDLIDKELKHISSNFGIGDRIEKLKKREAFISFKDHKDNFENNPKCRLINPAKSESGKLSKAFLDKINTTLREILNLNQWRNTQNVIEWFGNIENKNRHTFISFDIVDFYPSISEKLLDQALSWASSLAPISKDEISVIKHARKSLLFNNGKPWIKKDSSSLFDVTMGSFDGAEICELVGLFILNHLGSRFGKQNIGLYRDDGLAILKNKSARLADKTRKELHKIFEQFDLKITAEANLQVVNFLDVTFDLSTGKFKPYRKPNDDPIYVNKDSNHPPCIIRQLPTAINKRISLLSSDEQTFQEAAPTYQNALRHGNYQHKLEYMKHAPQQQSGRNRKRNIIWFNPPFSKSVKTNVGRSFLNLLDKHFPPSHKLHKIFNRNTVKVSYSCMDNVKSIVTKHNARIIRNNQPQSTITDSCNCTTKNICPLENQCMTRNIVYKATVTTHNTNTTKHYIGMTASTFKERYRNHIKSFKHKKYSNDTELSKYIWHLKNSNQDFNLTWSTVKRAISYTGGSKRCNLCLEEKLCILKEKNKECLLNKRSELVSTCNHKRMFRADYVTTKKS